MTLTAVQKHIARLARAMAEASGLTLWGVDVRGSERKSIVRVFLDTPDEGEVTIDQCAEVSRALSVALDAEDVVPGQYVLEVSSPGLERRFFEPSQLIPYSGRELNLTAKTPPDETRFPGRKRFQGKLRAVEDDRLTITLAHPEGAALDDLSDDDSSVDAATLTLDWGQLASVHLVHHFESPGKRPPREKRGK